MVVERLGENPLGLGPFGEQGAAVRGPRQGPRLPGGVRRLCQSGQPGLRGRAVACLVRRLHPVQRREPDHHRVGDRAQVGEGGGRVAETEVEHSQRPERGVAAVIVAGLASGRHEVAVLLRRLVRWRIPAVWWAVALLGPVTLIGAAVLADLALGATADPAVRFPGWAVLPLLLAVRILVGGPLGEELGWRGFLRPGSYPGGELWARAS